MKRVFTIFALLALLLCVMPTSVFAGSFVYEEAEIYNVSQILTQVQGERGFSFYARFTGSEERLLCTNELGQYDSRNWSAVAEDGGDITLRYWENDVQGNDSYFWLYPSLGEMIIAFTAPMTGNVTFDLEACLQVDPVDQENGILIICEREDGTKLTEDIEVIKGGKYEGGMARHSPKNVMRKVNFEIVEGETVYLRFNNREVGGNDQASVWFKMKYNRIGEAPATEPPATESPATDTTASVTDTVDTAPVVTDDVSITTSQTEVENHDDMNPFVIVGIVAAVIVTVVVVVVVIKKTKK